MDIRPMTEDIPFPSLSGIMPDKRISEVICPAYSAPASELTAILQYVYHKQYFEFENMHDIAFTYEQIFICEMIHLNILGKMLIKLGTDPLYVSRPPQRQNYYTTNCISYSKTPKMMLLDDINGEMRAIQQYREMIARLGDCVAGTVMSRIVMDEELHLNALKDIYSKIA